MTEYAQPIQPSDSLHPADTVKWLCAHSRYSQVTEYAQPIQPSDWVRTADTAEWVARNICFYELKLL